MGSSFSKNKNNKERCMAADKRSFGQTAGQIEPQREPINPDLYMKVGTITAYYEHIPSVVTIGHSLRPPTPPVRIRKLQPPETSKSIDITFSSSTQRSIEPRPSTSNNHSIPSPIYDIPKPNPKST